MQQGDLLPWVEKYRPESLEELISHKDIIGTIGKFINSGQLPHLLFHGPPGTGKTSTIHALSKFIYGEKKKQMVLELNASDDRGINVVRDAIKSFAESASTNMDCFEDIQTRGESGTTNLIFNRNFWRNVKLIILDEADMMTPVAQMALRRILEKYSEHVRFCIICNYVNKIIPALQSRCTRFRFSPLSINEMENKILVISKAEGIYTSKDGITALIEAARGDMRKVLNILQSCHMDNYGNVHEYMSSCDFTIMNENTNTYINEQMVHRTLGIPTSKEIDFLMNILTNKTFSEGTNALMNYYREYGYATQDFVNLLYRRLLKINWPDSVIPLIMKRLADIEYRLSCGASETVQFSAIVSCICEVRLELEKLL
ncbi:replication factor C, subunit 5, putative [Cryptosporidium muris RN66]|uniref:Replication factor C, subunit 5, putative n=1 Tax=Cryptosporidium muris (strain RN66) TaxID=441375 RepID=B6AFZ6_CRYMR|nr:replication factor C, subunit 5, putative [Cryptosporidium muris RN66]EEA07137.1 replication factor C, subunit 5, putative [Cryptosporidium muris RN66]|eukprot:XP_002141486.1 replication factor C, subunit 5 [Cryptosporidium muris RN66]